MHGAGEERHLPSHDHLPKPTYLDFTIDSASTSKNAAPAKTTYMESFASTPKEYHQLTMGRPPRADNTNSKKSKMTGGAENPYHDSVTRALMSKMAQGNLLHSGP